MVPIDFATSRKQADILPLIQMFLPLRTRFCGLKGHEMFCEVERSYIEDGFNLYGLRACVGNFSDCLDLILDRIGPDDSDDSHLTQSACTLYGLIHARYIITAHGLDAMYSKVGNCQGNIYPIDILCFRKSHCSRLSCSTGSASSVRCERLRSVSFDSMRRTTGATGWYEGRNGRRYGQDFLPQMQPGIFSTARKVPCRHIIGSGWSSLWHNFPTFVSHDVFKFSTGPARFGFNLCSTSFRISRA